MPRRIRLAEERLGFPAQGVSRPLAVLLVAPRVDYSVSPIT